MNRALGALVVACCFSCGGGGGGAKPPAEPVRAAAPVAEPAVPAPAAPQTPAQRALDEWLAAFNSGDEARLRAFATQYGNPDVVDLGFRQMTGGFELLGVLSSEARAMTIHVREKARPTEAVGWLRLDDRDPPRVVALFFQAIPPGLTAADMDRSLDAATRDRVIDAIAAKLAELYVFPEVAAKMDQALRAHQSSGAYDKVGESRAFAQLLTEQLQAVSHDRHLRVQFVPQVLPAKEAEPTAADEEEMRAHLDGINCGFQKAERLDGDIGYIKFDMFGPPKICGAKATAAFAALGDVRAVIFDLRENGGGDPAMVAFVSSYLFAKKTHLNDIYERKDNKTTPYWTDPKVPGKKLAKQPVYVLTSQHTFSGAEEFAYNLKNLKRATIIGETTGGGAHPTRGARVDDHFMIGVPFARAINPITKTNWEGTGVEPDVKVPAADALETAKKLAAKR
jgi:retinol-binding protein 3